MQCKCGGMTADRKQKIASYILEYARCPSCGRIGSEVLKDRRSGSELLKGLEAREMFEMHSSYASLRRQLEPYDLRWIGEYDDVGRWYPHNRYREYFSHIRPPSRNFPLSYARAAQTKKFAKWLIQNHLDTAESLNLVFKEAA